MAVKTACPFCKKNFSAPEEYRGKKVECPRCGRRSVLRTREDIEEEAELEAVERRRQDEDRKKIAFLEQVGSKRDRKAGVPYYEEFQTGVGGVRHYNPRASSRFLRFRALSDLLILGAYLEVLFVLAGIALTIGLWYGELIPGVTLLLVCLVGWLMGGTAVYLLLKYLGELAFLLADVGDQQNDLVQLLLDIRENTDEERSPEP